MYIFLLVSVLLILFIIYKDQKSIKEKLRLRNIDIKNHPEKYLVSEGGSILDPIENK